MAQYGNPGGELRRVSDIPTQKYEGWRGLRSDRVGLRMTESKKYKLRLSVTANEPGKKLGLCHNNTHLQVDIPLNYWTNGIVRHMERL